jgi:hypothetical protein
MGIYMHLFIHNGKSNMFMTNVRIVIRMIVWIILFILNMASENSESCYRRMFECGCIFSLKFPNGAPSIGPNGWRITTGDEWTSGAHGRTPWLISMGRK